MSIFQTLDHLHALGAADGRQRGNDDGACQQLGKLLLRHGKRLFGEPSDEQRALLNSLIDTPARLQLEQLQDRLLKVQDWATLLADLTLPGERLPDPEWLLPFDFDPTPETASIDEYARVDLGGMPLIMHIRFQKLYQEDIGALLWKDTQQVQQQQGCPVQTMLLLLWPGADGPAMSGQYRAPTGEVFRFQVTRLWERDAEEMLASIATAALAPLGRFAPERLPEIVRRMEEILETQARNDEDRTNFWFLAYSSMGLRYSAAEVNPLLAHKLDYLYQLEPCRRIRSDGFYAGRSTGLEEGKLQATQRWILHLGSSRLGEPPALVADALATLGNLERLEQLAARALKAASWQEVLKPG